MPWRTQSGLPNPSLAKESAGPTRRSALAFSRSPLDTLLSGFLLAHSWWRSASSNPSMDLLAWRLAGCASNPTSLSAPPLVVWLGFTTFWRRTTERKLRGFWGGCDGKFHLFHQVLGWSSCLRSPTKRHAVVHLGRIVSRDLFLSSWSLCLWYFETYMTHVQGTMPSIDCIRQVLGLWPSSTSAWIRFVCIDVQLVFAMSWKVGKSFFSLISLTCENHVRELRTFFTVVLEPNIHTFSVLSETLQDFLKSKLC